MLPCHSRFGGGSLTRFTKKPCGGTVMKLKRSATQCDVYYLFMLRIIFARAACFDRASLDGFALCERGRGSDVTDDSNAVRGLAGAGSDSRVVS